MDLFIETDEMRAQRRAAAQGGPLEPLFVPPRQPVVEDASGGSTGDVAQNETSAPAGPAGRQADGARRSVRSGATESAALQASAQARPDRSYSLEQEQYQEALAYDRRRTRRRKLAVVLRALAIILLVPVALVFLFVASYLLTCIYNGASPDELGGLLADLAARVQDHVAGLGAQVTEWFGLFGM